MRKLFKLLFSLVFVVIVLAVLAAVVVTVFVDPNDFKPQIAKFVEDRTGRSLAIDGDLKLSVFPWLGLQLGTTSLGNAKGFQAAEFARIEKVDINVKLLPLLRKELEMDTVVLHGLQLNLEKDKQGHTNWDDLAGSGESAPDEESSGGLPLAALAIGGLEVRDAGVSWRDASSGQHVELKKLNMTTGGIAPGHSTNLDIAVDFASTAPGAEGSLALSGAVQVSDDGKRFEVGGLKLRTDMTGEAVPVPKLTLAVQGEVAGDLEADTLKVDDLLLEILGITMRGDARISSLTATPGYTAGLNVQEFNPKALLERIGADVPATRDPAALTRAGFSTQVQGTTESIHLQSVRAQLDDTVLEGDFNVAGFKGPTLRFDLQGDQLDLDRYLPPPEAGSGSGAGAPAAAPATPATAAGVAAETLPLDLLRSLDVDGRFRFKQFAASNLKVTDISMTLKGKKGLLKLDPIEARLYDGGYKGSTQLDVRTDTPRVHVQETLTGVQAGPLLKDLTGEEKILGTANLSADLSFAGLQDAEIRPSLNGDARFEFVDGAVKGVNLASLIREAKARLKGQSLPAEDKQVQTDFSELSGTVNIANGIARNEDLSVKSPLLRVTGKGKADLVREKIDYLLTTTIVETTEGAGGADLKDLKGLSIPVRVSGSFDKPSYAPDLGAVLTDKVKDKVETQVKKEVDKKKEDLEQKLKDKIGDKGSELLKGLLKR